MVHAFKLSSICVQTVNDRSLPYFLERPPGALIRSQPLREALIRGMRSFEGAPICKVTSLGALMSFHKDTIFPNYCE